MNIAERHVVSLQYTVKNSDGEVIDSSEGRGPLVYLHGFNNIVPGLEKALSGKAVNDSFEVVIQPEDAYGERHAQMIQEVPRAAFEGMEEELQAGQRFTATTEDGQPLSVVITEVSEETVTVDGNHPLAGIELHFSVLVEDIRQATEEELLHGHAHSEGGCGH